MGVPIFRGGGRIGDPPPPPVLFAGGLGGPGEEGGALYASPPPPWAEGCGVGAISFRKQSRKGPGGGGRGGPRRIEGDSDAKRPFWWGGGLAGGHCPPPPPSPVSLSPPQYQPYCVQKVCIGTKPPLFFGGGGRHGMDGVKEDPPPQPPQHRGSHLPAPTLSTRTPNPFFLGGVHHPLSLFFFWGGGLPWDPPPQEPR